MRDSMGTQAHATGEARMLRSLPRTRWLACLSGSSRNLLYRNRTSGAPHAATSDKEDCTSILLNNIKNKDSHAVFSLFSSLYNRHHNKRHKQTN